MKILIVSVDTNKGGAESVLKKISNYFLSRNHEVYFYSFKSSDVNFWNELTFKKGFKRLKLIELINLKVDVTFTSHIATNFFVDLIRTIRLFNSKKHIVRESTNIFLRYKGLKRLKYRLMYFFGYQNIDIVIFQTHNQRNSIVKKIKKLQNKNLVIDNPFIYPSEKITSEHIFIQKKFIVSAGRLIKEKGFDLLIQAFKELNLSDESYELLILGEGSERSNLESLITKLKLCDNVFLKGNVANVYPYFKKSSCCVVSSRVEGFPNVLLEMMSVNNNIVSTLCAGGIENIPGIIKCEKIDVNSLKKAIDHALKSRLLNSQDNRVLFDEFLEERDINTFISKLNNL